MTTMREEVDKWVDRYDLSCKIADGFDDHILGMLDGLVVYSSKGIIKSLIDDGMDRHEAFEYFSFNIHGAVVPGGPIYVNDLLLGDDL